MKYIVSLVFTRLVPAPPSLMDKPNRPKLPDIDIQNVLGVMEAASAEEAYKVITQNARLKYPQHNLSVRNVIEAKDTDLM